MRSFRCGWATCGRVCFRGRKSRAKVGMEVWRSDVGEPAALLEREPRSSFDFDEQSLEVVVRSYAGGNCDVMLAGQDTEGAREPGCSIDFISFVKRQGVLMVILEHLIRSEMDQGRLENSIGNIGSHWFCVGFGNWGGCR